jgi:hypothetical protein
MYWDMQHGYGYVVLTWLFSLDVDMDKQHMLAHADLHVQAA